ncbi:MAG: insulinase family protein [Chitinophagales bacterium]|nr:insulinase family protein [Chitinophagales bacterium]
MIGSIDRKTAPSLDFDNTLSFPDFKRGKLNNGIPYLIVNDGEQDLVKINFIFNAGKWFEPKKLVGKLCNKLMREGSNDHTSAELAEKLDFYGVTLRNQCKAFTSVYSVYVLNKHLASVLPLLEEIFFNASLPEEELSIILLKEKQRLKVQLQRNDFVSSQEFFKHMYGDHHPFGYRLDIEDHKIDLLPDIKSFYSSNYINPEKICIAGKIKDVTLNLLDKHFGQNTFKSVVYDKDRHKPNGTSELEHRTSIDNSVQSAIRIGGLLFNKTHPDYFDFKIVNTILGGYFGSRLMSNIREEKGYTYGIYSSCTSLLEGGYFSIATEVGHKYTEDTLKEISFELKRLQTELISDEELNTVKNYMSSKIQGSLDGPFHSSATLNDLWMYDLDNQYLKDYMDRVNDINAEDIRHLAQKYLNIKDMYKIIVS